MAGKFVQGNWLLPNNANANKQSNYSLTAEASQAKYLDFGTELWDLIKSSNEFSISLWCKVPSGAGTSGDFIPFNFGTELLTSGSQSQRLWLSMGGGSTVFKIRNNGTVVLEYSNPPNDVWTHYVFSVKIGSNTADQILYKDGQPVATTSSAITSISSSSSFFYINQYYRSNYTGAIGGSFDEYSFFTKALSSGEVSSLYNSGTPGNPFNLSGDPVAYYKLGETAVFQNTSNEGNIFQVPNHAQSQQAITATNGNNFTQLVTPVTQLGNTHTLSIWINSNGVANIPVGQFFVQGSISSYYNPYTTSADGIYVTTDQANGQSLPLSSIIYRSNNNQLTASIGQLDDGDWHNLIIVRTPTAVKAYIDGGSELTLSGATLTSSDTYLLRFLTGIYSAQGAAWPGIISNPAIWLSDRSSEVANIYNSGEPQANYTTAPDYWWKLDNSTQISAVPPTTGSTPIINYKTISSNTLTTFNSKTAVVNQGYGFSSGVSMLFDNQINLGTQSTVSYWLLSAPFETSKSKFNTHGGGVNIFSNYQDQVGVGTYGGAYILKGPSNNVITLEIYNSTNSSEKATLTFSQANNPTEYAKIFDLNYHNWMFVRDGSNVSFYFDNVLIDSSSSLNATNNTVLIRFSGTMGTAASPTTNWGGNKFSNGVEVDEVSLFNKALSSSERATLYNSGNAGDISSLSPSIWYNGDSVDFTNSKMLDLSGNSNDASLVNTSQGSSNTGLLTNFQQILTYKEGAFAGGSAGTAGLALVNTDLGLNNPLYSQFSTWFPAGAAVDTNFTLPAYTKYSYSFWYKKTISTTFSGDRTIIGNLKEGSGGNVDTRGVVMLNNENILVMTGNGSVDYSNSSFDVSSLLLDQNWHHVVLTWINGQIQLFIDGSLENTYTDSNIITGVAAEATTKLGRLNTQYSKWLTDSLIDEFAIFNRQLSNTEIISIYNNGKPTSLASHSPVQWWRLGDTGYATTTASNSTLTYPNEISGQPNGVTTASMQPSINADAPKVVAPGSSSGLVELDKKGEAPNSTSNSISYNILKTDQSVYTPKYVSQYTVDNNYSMAFDGSNDYITIPKDSALSLVNTDFSISIWLNPNVSHNGLVVMNYASSKGWGVYYNSGDLRFRAYPSVWETLTTIPTSVWTHILIVGDDTGNNLLCYKNGVEVYNNSYTLSIVESTDNVYIGSQNGGNFFFNGSIDEVAIFNKVLTADQIKFDIYKASATANKSADFINNPNLPDPVAWYRMGD